MRVPWVVIPAWHGSQQPPPQLSLSPGPSPPPPLPAGPLSDRAVPEYPAPSPQGSGRLRRRSRLFVRASARTRGPTRTRTLMRRREAAAIKRAAPCRAARLGGGTAGGGELMLRVTMSMGKDYIASQPHPPIANGHKARLPAPPAPGSWALDSESAARRYKIIMALLG